MPGLAVRRRMRVSLSMVVILLMWMRVLMLMNAVWVNMRNRAGMSMRVRMDVVRVYVVVVMWRRGGSLRETCRGVRVVKLVAPGVVVGLRQAPPYVRSMSSTLRE